MSAEPAEVTAVLGEVEEAFIGLWRGLSGLWGISPTMAEIHGLLYITGAALSTDDIMARLAISRSNVSMNVGKLVEWGLVRRAHKRGDRREYFESLGDVWEMFALVASQRKRREVDPILGTLRRCSDRLAEDRPQTRGHRRRVEEMLTFLSLIDELAQRFFESHKGLREAVQLLARKDD